jgi:hypothetical protein
MSNAVTRNQATPSQRNNYIEALLDIEEGIEEATSVLTARKSRTNDPQENAVIRAGILDLEAELAKVRAAINAFRARRGKFRPPTAAEVNKIRGLVKELDEMVADAVTANKILDLATGLLNEFGQMKA